jgi:hypothetical protein
VGAGWSPRKPLEAELTKHVAAVAKVQADMRRLVATRKETTEPHVLKMLKAYS